MPDFIIEKRVHSVERELENNEIGLGKATIYFAMIGMFLRPIHRVESVRQSAASAA